MKPFCKENQEYFMALIIIITSDSLFYYCSNNGHAYLQYGHYATHPVGFPQSVPLFSPVLCVLMAFILLF